METPTFQPFGERAILVTWEAFIKPDIHENVVNFDRMILQKFGKEILETVITYQSLAIYLTHGIQLNKFIKELKSSYATMKTAEHSFPSHLITIPVCYDAHFAPDIEYVAHENNVLVEEVIGLHSEPIYKVYFMGFLPGFPYLGGLNERIHTPRKTKPERSIPKGSVGIGGKQTGIYPNESPGGWHIIGRSPMSFFDAVKNPPTFIQAGDYVKFESVAKEEFEHIKTLVINDLYFPNKMPYHD
ncbi:MAG: 5-oxoprolinase subunit PxpB [Aureisphaera sp.]